MKLISALSMLFAISVANYFEEEVIDFTSNFKHRGLDATG